MVGAMKSELCVPVTRRGIINDALAQMNRYVNDHLKKHGEDAEELACTMVIGIKGGSYVTIFVDGILDLEPSIVNVDLEKVMTAYRTIYTDFKNKTNTQNKNRKGRKKNGTEGHGAGDV